MPGRFSQRIGATEVRSVVQVETIDAPLRNRLWSLVYICLDTGGGEMKYSQRAEAYRDIYLNFFELPIDAIPDWLQHANDSIKSYFYQPEWYKPYDLLEFVLNHLWDSTHSDEMFELANTALQKYLSGYRFVNGRLVPITDESHIQTIEDALQSPLTGVRTHLSKSLALLSARDATDPENAIKEAVSAVESLCASIVGKRDTLGAAIKKLEDAGVSIHPALKESWLKLYGYTSDGDGIRHSLQLESSVTVDDALYFLVSCSAFIGLLTAKASAAGISLQPVK
ncbi:AbiJ-NTD4 domain-containing protein [Nocardioides terrigena]|uniref:AbiJ-NTD4 domain-containing protein n=1 Tax=Nocardioides terrigena TaxID=424797 RepID=UPI00131F416E|nr:hypothetical protein [Nocardioides terrigena]